MGKVWLPGDSDFALAMRGWPTAPGVKRTYGLEINEAHPFAANLLYAQCWIDGNRDLSGKAAPPTTVGAPVLSYDERGGYYAYTGSSYHRLNLATNPYNFKSISNGLDISILVVAKTYSTSTRQAVVADWNSSGTGQTLVVEFTNTGGILARAGFSGSSTIKSGINAGQWYTIGLVNDAGSSLCYPFVDGISGSQFSSSLPPNPSGTQGVAIGRGGEYNGLYLNGGVAGFFVWQGQMPFAVMREATRNFATLLRPPEDFPFLINVPAAGGTPTLSSPGVINVLSDRATPQVTLTF